MSQVSPSPGLASLLSKELAYRAGPPSSQHCAASRWGAACAEVRNPAPGRALAVKAPWILLSNEGMTPPPVYWLREQGQSWEEHQSGNMCVWILYSIVLVHRQAHHYHPCGWEGDLCQQGLLCPRTGSDEPPWRAQGLRRKFLDPCPTEVGQLVHGKDMENSRVTLSWPKLCFICIALLPRECACFSVFQVLRNINRFWFYSQHLKHRIEQYGYELINMN